jgi:hypothetical protein
LIASPTRSATNCFLLCGFKDGVYGTNMELARTRNFQTGGAAASKCHVPVFELTTTLCDMATARSSHLVDEIKEIVDSVFDAFALTLETRWDNLRPEEQAELLARQADSDTVMQIRPRGVEGLTLAAIHPKIGFES